MLLSPFHVFCFPTRCLVLGLPQPVLNALFNAFFYRSAERMLGEGAVTVSIRDSAGFQDVEKEVLLYF